MKELEKIVFIVIGYVVYALVRKYHLHKWEQVIRDGKQEDYLQKGGRDPHSKVSEGIAVLLAILCTFAIFVGYKEIGSTTNSAKPQTAQTQSTNSPGFFDSLASVFSSDQSKAEEVLVNVVIDGFLNGKKQVLRDNLTNDDGTVTEKDIESICNRGGIYKIDIASAAALSNISTPQFSHTVLRAAKLNDNRYHMTVQFKMEPTDYGFIIKNVLVDRVGKTWKVNCAAFITSIYF